VQDQSLSLQYVMEIVRIAGQLKEQCGRDVSMLLPVSCLLLFFQAGPVG
jgi:hypothetical protein